MIAAETSTVINLYQKAAINLKRKKPNDRHQNLKDKHARNYPELDLLSSIAMNSNWYELSSLNPLNQLPSTHHVCWS